MTTNLNKTVTKKNTRNSKKHAFVCVNLNSTHFKNTHRSSASFCCRSCEQQITVLYTPLSRSRVFQVCGSPDIPLHLLKSVATYKGVEPTAPLIQWFWEVMESFSNTERSLFLRFVWGRTRLPRTIADFRGRDFVVQVSDLNLQ